MSDYENSETRSPWWRPTKTTPKLFKQTTSSDARSCAFRNKISMVEAGQNHPNIINNITSSDARL